LRLGNRGGDSCAHQLVGARSTEATDLERLRDGRRTHAVSFHLIDLWRDQWSPCDAARFCAGDPFQLPLASPDKFYAARSAVPPHHMASRCRFEAIQRQIKIGRKDVKRAVKLSSLIVDISHDAGVNAGNSVKVKHRGLVDFNAL
jgi:hypothetical protein